MHKGIFTIQLILIVIFCMDNDTEITTISCKGCHFFLTLDNSTFLYCKTARDIKESSWIGCLRHCCCGKGDSGDSVSIYNSIIQCQADECIDEEFDTFALVIYIGVGIIFLTLFICVTAILVKLILKYYGNRVNQSPSLNLEIEWKEETHQLTVEISELKWISTLKKDRNKHGETCIICLQASIYTELYCGHEYHPQCIEKWLKKSNFCPLCHRTEIRSIKHYCSACSSHYIICRKGFLSDHSNLLTGLKCNSCEKDVKIELVELPSEAPSSALILDDTCHHLESGN